MPDVIDVENTVLDVAETVVLVPDVQNISEKLIRGVVKLVPPPPPLADVIA